MEPKIEIEHYTARDSFRRVAGYTTGRECHMTWERALALGHSVIRANIYFLSLRNIPLCAASQLVRHHVGVSWWQKSLRPDRGGADFGDECGDLAHSLAEEIRNVESGRCDFSRSGIGKFPGFIRELPDSFDRLRPTDLCGIINAEELINISRRRLCAKAEAPVREVWSKVIDALAELDPVLAEHCVPECVATGICREPRPCGHTETPRYADRRRQYQDLFLKPHI